MQTSLHPLAGVQVIEFCHVAAGPYCGMLLADFGADRHEDRVARR
jgi:crotonobetainyl-CoA:carnitine CoA-transferase CaiB-like acyl-CoA transferase